MGLISENTTIVTVIEKPRLKSHIEKIIMMITRKPKMNDFNLK